MDVQVLLPRVLFLFGVGFLVANVKVVVDLLRFRARKRAALLTWAGPKPRFYGFCLALGVTLGLLLAFKLFVLQRPIHQLFGEAMMFVYYGYAFPLSTKIARGFYRDGIWADSGFMRWGQISAVSWREGDRVTLVLISRLRQIARKLEVPGNFYGEARRLLRDKIKTHDIRIGGAGLDLGTRDDADAV
jgi:hypothetical protein